MLSMEEGKQTVTMIMMILKTGMFIWYLFIFLYDFYN